MASSSWKTYRTAVASFQNFCSLYNFDVIWPIPVELLSHYIAFLSCEGKSFSTVSTYLSALSYAHKLNNVIDNTKSFLVTKLLQGFRRKNPTKPDIRIPITFDLLKKLISSLQWICHSDYESYMFASTFSLAYFALLRVGEFAVTTTDNESGHALDLRDISFLDKNTVLHANIRSSKTDQKRSSIKLILTKQENVSVCPIFLLHRYLSIRFSGQNGSEKLFVHFNGKPLTKYQFCAMLEKSLKFCEIPLHIRSHSFRIGRASDLAKEGIDDEAIKKLGRWKSSCFERYIRL